MKRPSLLWVDHAYHRRTQSFAFLRRLLEAEYAIEEWMVAPRAGRAWLPPARAAGHDYIVFCQLLPFSRQLRQLRGRCLWVPMYDGVGENPWFWRRLGLTGLSVLSFSRALLPLVALGGNRRLEVQYHADPAEYPGMAGEPDVLFMWDRGDLSPLIIAELFNAAEVRRVILLRRPDPGCRLAELPDAFRRAYHVEEHGGEFRERAWYLDLVRPAGVVIAPRRREGIGHVTTEALAMGKCVVAHDAPTMNEYIVEGVNGFLVDSGRPRRLAMEDVRRVHRTVPDAARRGFEAWVREQALLQAFVRETPVSRPRGFWRDLSWAARELRTDWPSYRRELRAAARRVMSGGCRRS